MTWNAHLKKFTANQSGLLDQTFLARWGGRAWAPNGNDRKAAGALHTQIISRITTVPLSYLDGVETTAPESVHSLFAKTREICDQYPCAWHFKTVVWQILNSRVRPFTAKWHPVSKRGGLEALDTTDEFRAELAELQVTVCDFEDFLLELRDGKPPPVRPTQSHDAREAAVKEEMDRELVYGIPQRLQRCPILGVTDSRRDGAGESRRRPPQVGHAEMSEATE